MRALVPFLKLARGVRRFFRKDDDGNATVEFVLVFPVYMVLFISTFEAGLMMVRHFMLERGLDEAIRTIRLTTAQTWEADDIRQMICENAMVIPDCEASVRIEMERIDPRIEFKPDRRHECIDASDPSQPAENFGTGGEHDVMLLRACALFDVWFPATGLGMQMPKIGDQYALVSLGAFVMEPE